MLPIQRLNRILAEAYRRAWFATINKRGAQNKTAKTKGYDNNDNFRAKSATARNITTSFAYNAGLPKDTRVIIDNLDAISSQSVQKKEAVAEYKELDKSYDYEYFQISRRDGFCAILRIGVLNGSTTESLREKNKRVKANRRSSGSFKKDKYIAHVVVLTYGAVWEPEITESENGQSVASLNFNESNWNRLFTPGLVDPSNTASGYPGSYTSVRFWDKSNIIANGIADTGVGVSEFELNYTAGPESGIFPSDSPPSYPFNHQFVLDLHKGICDFKQIRENTLPGSLADTRFTVSSISGFSHPVLHTASISGGSPRGESFGELTQRVYESNDIGRYSSAKSQISWGSPIVINRDQVVSSAYPHLQSLGDGSGIIYRRQIDTSSTIYPKGFQTIGADTYGIDNVYSRGANQNKTKLSLVLNGVNSTEYLTLRDNTDPGSSGPGNFYYSDVFVLPESSVEIHDQQLWLNYRTEVSGVDKTATNTNYLIWQDWQSPIPTLSVTDAYWEPSVIDKSESIFYVIEDNSGAKNKASLCKWCIGQKVSDSKVTYKWMSGSLDAFRTGPGNDSLAIKTAQFTTGPSSHPGSIESEYVVSDGTGYLGHTFYSNLSLGLLPLIRYAESSYLLSDQTKLTVKLSKGGSLYICKANPEANLTSTSFDPLSKNGTAMKLIPFSIPNIADRLELPDTSYYAYASAGDAKFFSNMPLEIQTVPSSARSIAAMYFNPDRYNLSASLGIISMGSANLDSQQDDLGITIDQYLDVFSSAQFSLKNYYYR